MARTGGYRRLAVWRPCGVTPHAALQNKSVVCSGSRVTISTVMKLHWSVKRGGIIVKRIQRALAHTHTYIIYIIYYKILPNNNPSSIGYWWPGHCCNCQCWFWEHKMITMAKNNNNPISFTITEWLFSLTCAAMTQLWKSDSSWEQRCWLKSFRFQHAIITDISSTQYAPVK